ncbi:MAG: hypothetical protein M3Y86_12670 [Verrucomicrobiota bacterium]|nr:hypothetical protein [Verrucomicrobiota bacterium]
MGFYILGAGGCGLLIFLPAAITRRWRKSVSRLRGVESGRGIAVGVALANASSDERPFDARIARIIEEIPQRRHRRHG